MTQRMPLREVLSGLVRLAAWIRSLFTVYREPPGARGNAVTVLAVSYLLRCVAEKIFGFPASTQGIGCWKQMIISVLLTLGVMLIVTPVVVFLIEATVPNGWIDSVRVLICSGTFVFLVISSGLLEVFQSAFNHRHSVVSFPVPERTLKDEGHSAEWLSEMPFFTSGYGDSSPPPSPTSSTMLLVTPLSPCSSFDVQMSPCPAYLRQTLRQRSRL